MQGRGCPIWTPGYAVALWAQGAGFWAGSAQACGVDCGTSLLGVELFPEFNDSTYSHAECPPGVGPAAWPCTPEGAYAHELGHILGLVHPDGVPATQPVAGHSIMLTHWNFPDYAPPAEAPWGFLTVERQQLSSNPFMGLSVPTDQIYHDCDVVNLPAPPSIPTAAFTWLGGPNSVSFQNQSTGAVQYLWDFGDGATSNTATPVHPYAAGSYTVTLRAMADGGGLAMVQHALDVVGVAGGAGAEAALAIAPNPVRLSGDRSALRLRFALMRPEEVGLGLYTPAGKLVATRAAVPLAAGAQEISWDLAGAAARSLPPGVYALRLDAGAESRRATVIVLR